MATVDPKNPWLKGMDQDSIMFANQAEMVEAMSSPHYAKDPAYREVVAKMIENGVKAERGTPATENTPAVAPVVTPGFTTSRQLSRAMVDVDGLRKAEDAAIFREQSLKLFADPRYQSSPTYRREVQEWIRANEPAIDAMMPPGTLIDRNQAKYQPMRIQLGANGDAVADIRETIRQGKIEAAKQRAEAAKAELDAELAEELGDIGPDQRHDGHSPA